MNRLREIDSNLAFYYQILAKEFDIYERKRIYSEMDKLNLERMELINDSKRCDEQNDKTDRNTSMVDG